jgi:hypothetical protein
VTPVAAVAAVAVRFAHREDSSFVADPRMPQIEAHPALVPGDGYALLGTLTGRRAVTSGIEVHAYPRSAEGLVLGYVGASITDHDLSPGAAASFASGTVPQAFTLYRMYVSFVDGKGD